MLASLDMPHGPHSANMFALEIVGDICIPCFVVGMLHSQSCLNYVPLLWLVLEFTSTYIYDKSDGNGSMD